MGDDGAGAGAGEGEGEGDDNGEFGGGAPPYAETRSEVVVSTV